jgi:hypothetical protein
LYRARFDKTGDVTSPPGYTRAVHAWSIDSTRPAG